MDDLYQEELLEAARAPHNYGKLLEADLASPAQTNSCGDSCRVFLKLTSDKKTITTATWEGSGCVISTAGLSILSDKLQNEKIETVLIWNETTLFEWFGFTNFAAARKKCLLLGLHAVQKLLKEQ
ncbi:MAG: iron-sulfur cluster assembly scaffold protein [Candidatus Pacebacteria bacterium]|nr:iron-sulfur cluster assembly scaffold protein [Candidatus Paceibacterota bacterium]PIR59870.1 MAG: hypothetical protein COU67_04390 [Candidatus Pacebacteria bacterium CG10_big_fil_rev_8_21_14_0_10_44_54]